MKTLTIAAVMLALIAAPAGAQMKRRPSDDGKKTEDKTPKVDEKAYKAALERIPTPRKNTIPGAWRVRRRRPRNQNRSFHGNNLKQNASLSAVGQGLSGGSGLKPA